MPTVAPDLVEILVCPETKQPVRLMSGAELERLNERIRGGQLRNRGGSEVKQALAEALVRQDGRIAYPVDDGIPVMLVDESVEL
jgi:uncharacterized protein YbaR (Trm112 family)